MGENIGSVENDVGLKDRIVVGAKNGLEVESLCVTLVNGSIDGTSVGTNETFEVGDMVGSDEGTDD